MAPVDTVLLAATLAVGLGVLALTWRIRRGQRAADGLEDDALSAALGRAWRDLEFDEAVGRLESHADELRSLHGDVSDLLGTPQHRGAFGERQLETILADRLPPDAYGVREEVVDGRTPDAYVDAPGGLLCIDAKFPLDNYEAFLEAETEEARERARRAFRRNVESQLRKVAEDYVRPAEGTAEFAVAFVPSESVFYHLLREEYDLLREYTREGVQVVSPLTFGHRLEVLRTDVQARRLSEEAAAIGDRLERLEERFDAVEDEWATLDRHLRNARQKADDVDRRYGALRDEFDRIAESSPPE